VLQATPGAWRLLIDAGWTASLPLKVLCGGEALPRDLADKLLERSDDVWNVYGPTETTIWSSATRVTAGTGRLCIGPPIANTQFYVLDENHSPLGIGVSGELYIGGEGLAKGYWNRPELTAEKFLPNPFAEGRVYRTGDLARWTSDGRIELLGRADFQVKIRGYRIELGDIESALTRHHHVREAVVVQQQSKESGTSSLVAFVDSGEVSDEKFVTELRTLVAGALPEYMVPSVIVPLSSLPRTPNGKIDRKALPHVAGSNFAGPESKAVFTEPVNEEERKLAAIWSEVIGLEKVSTTDSIFELGADSLIIFRIAARAQREGIPITATQVFQLRTVAALCDNLARKKIEAAAPLSKSKITVAARKTYRAEVVADA
jgi:acyl-coenzyme A synthetase/AMP-(fatty) acid ligase/acyl carrier protein